MANNPEREDLNPRKRDQNPGGPEGAGRNEQSRREHVARRAYERFKARGEEPGRDQEDWFAAEREVEKQR